MFVNRVETTEDCFAGAICLDTSWLIHRLSAIVFAFVVGTPAMRIMYVALGLIAAYITYIYLFGLQTLAMNKVFVVIKPFCEFTIVYEFTV